MSRAYIGFIYDSAIQLLMEKLGDITVQNSFNLTASCQIDQSLLAKNFTTIINALKELQLAQQKNESQIKDISSLKDKINAFEQKIGQIEKSTPISPGQCPCLGVYQFKNLCVQIEDQIQQKQSSSVGKYPCDDQRSRKTSEGNASLGNQFIAFNFQTD